MSPIVLQIVLIAFAIFVSWQVVKALRTGRASARGVEFDRNTSPKAYWFVVACALAMIGSAVYALTFDKGL